MHYHRLAHLKDTPLVKKGDWVKRGDHIGFVGSTGNSTGPHLHYDILNFAVAAAQMLFTQYVYGLSKFGVQARYINPNPYINGNIPAQRSLPKIGYHFLEYVADGNYYHPGEDVNGVNDLGRPVYAPVEGRVVYVLGTNWLKNIFGKFVSKNFNAGWGNMIVIEEMPNYKLPTV